MSNTLSDFDIDIPPVVPADPPALISNAAQLEIARQKAAIANRLRAKPCNCNQFPDGRHKSYCRVTKRELAAIYRQKKIKK